MTSNSELKLKTLLFEFEHAEEVTGLNMAHMPGRQPTCRCVSQPVDGITFLYRSM